MWYLNNIQAFHLICFSVIPYISTTFACAIRRPSISMFSSLLFWMNFDADEFIFFSCGFRDPIFPVVVVVVVVGSVCSWNSNSSSVRKATACARVSSSWTIVWYRLEKSFRIVNESLHFRSAFGESFFWWSMIRFVKLFCNRTNLWTQLLCCAIASARASPDFSLLWRSPVEI